MFILGYLKWKSVIWQWKYLCSIWCYFYHVLWHIFYLFFIPHEGCFLWLCQVKFLQKTDLEKDKMCFSFTLSIVFSFSLWKTHFIILKTSIKCSLIGLNKHSCGSFIIVSFCQSQEIVWELLCHHTEIQLLFLSLK